MAGRSFPAHGTRRAGEIAAWGCPIAREAAMDLVPWLVGLVVCVLSVRWSRRRGWVDLSGTKVRRGTGHALLGLQEFIEPSVEHILAAENAEQIQEDSLAADQDDPAAIKEGLATSLARSTIDLEEVRRHLSAAARAGLDWRALYDVATREEVAARLYKAPSIPPPWRVAPRI